MYFVIGIAFAAVSVLLLGLCYIGARNPKKPKWAGDFLLGSIYVPGIIMLLILSTASFYWFVRDYATHPLSTGQGATALIIGIGALIAWRLMNVKKRIKTYEQNSSGTVINVNFQQEFNTTPPKSGRKAA